MDPLADLCGRLKTQAAATMGMKAYLYVEKSGERMRHGRVFLYRNGQCVVEFEDQDTSTALHALRDLAISRLVTLLDPTLIKPSPGISSIPVEAVLARLTGGARDTIPALPEPPPAALFKPEPPARPRTEPSAASAPTTISLPPANEMLERAQRVLEEFFGGAAARRVQDIAQRFPPADQPAAFLVAAETLLSTMAGPRKAANEFNRIRSEWGL